MSYIPYVNTAAGWTLTPKQWMACGITCLAYEIHALLQRPYFLAQTHIAYLIDARGLVCDAQNIFSYRSSDGALKKMHLNDLAEFLFRLKAKAIIWPYADIPSVISDLVTQGNKILAEHIVSDQAAAEGCSAHFWSADAYLSILDKPYEKDLSVLATDCDCYTCQSLSSKAYLHHLYQHTPLLAQRYLIEHNVRQMVLLSIKGSEKSVD